MKSNLARQARADAAERTGKEVSKVVKEDIKKLSSRELARMNIPNSGMTVGHLAAKAFLYGTALCLGTSALAVVGIAWYLDVRNLNEFSRKMENLVPNFRTKLEDLIGSPVSNESFDSFLQQPTNLPIFLQLQSVSNVAENKAVPMIRDSVGQAIQKSVPAITNKHEEDELAGLTKKEKKLVQEWTQWLQEQTEDKDRKD